jgi:hypothetical protein
MVVVRNRAGLSPATPTSVHPKRQREKSKGILANIPFFSALVQEAHVFIDISDFFERHGAVSLGHREICPPAEHSIDHSCKPRYFVDQVLRQLTGLKSITIWCVFPHQHGVHS